MATHRAIAGVGQAVRRLLEATSRQTNDFSTVQFALAQTADLQKPAATDTVFLYLYRVAVNGSQRNRPPRTDTQGRRFRPSLPIDLYYLLIPSATSAERQQRLIGWCVRVLEDAAILPPGLLNDAADPDTFGTTETVELVFDNLGLQDLFNIWDPLKPNMQLSVPYVARVVMLDSTTEMTEGQPVQTRLFSMRKGAE